MIDQFRARLDDIKSVVSYQSQLQSLKWAMSEQKKALIEEETSTAADLEKWHTDELTTPKPVVANHAATKAKIDAASTTIDSILASMAQTVAQIDKAMGELT